MSFDVICPDCLGETQRVGQFSFVDRHGQASTVLRAVDCKTCKAKGKFPIQPTKKAPSERR